MTMKKLILLFLLFIVQVSLYAQEEYFPEGTKWTEIRLDTLKYNNWYSKVGDEWVPNFETIEYRVQGEYGKASDNYWNAPYKCVYTNSAEWTDSLTLLISEGEINELPTGVLATVLDVDQPLCPSSYPFEWEIGTMIRFKSILAANATAIFHPGLFDFGVVEEIREGDFGGVRPLKYSDVKGVRMIQGIGVATWNDGECVFGPLEPYNASPTPHEESRHYRSMLVHFERDGEVLYDVWPEINEPVTYTEGQMATIILPTEPDASKGKYYRLDRCEKVEGQTKGQIVFEQELQPRARVPYIIVPSEDFSIDLSSLDLEGLTKDSVSIEGISFIGSYQREELPALTDVSSYIDIIDTTPDCSLSPSGETGQKAVIGALRAYLSVRWDDPIDYGGTRGPQERLEVVLRDHGTSIGQPREEEMVNGKSSNGECFDLCGRKIVNGNRSNGKYPKEIYIEKGRKRVVK